MSDHPFNAPTPERGRVIATLNGVKDPKTGRGLGEAGLVQALVLRPGRVGFMLEVDRTETALYAPIRDAAEAALSGLPGVEKVQVVLTTKDRPPGVSHAAPQGVSQGVSQGAQTEPRSARPVRATPAMKPAHVRQVIAVASGKGGVGKSTVAVNLSTALAVLGYGVGLLDADVYGPSVPRMLGLTQRPVLGSDKKLVPLLAFGMKVVSIGLLVDEGAPMIWRGPMASSALGQLLDDVAWGAPEAPLDILVIDMPPGTGDVQLTLAQKVRLDGAVIVSTPQEVALIDVRRGAAMFQQTHTPILGVIENMAYFPDPATGEPIEIFGRGGGRRVAEEVGAPFLGELPLDISLRRSGDDGVPVVVSNPDGASAIAFLGLAAAVADALKHGGAQKPAPLIEIRD